jgi:DNA-binding transcriptional MerR regulator
MPYTMTDIRDLTGVTSRTIRVYMQRGLLAKPKGHGLAAEYDEEHLLRATFIARMRAQGEAFDAIAECLGTWSVAKLRAFVRRTNPAEGQGPIPAQAAVPPTEAAAASSPTPESEPATPRGQLPRPGDRTGTLEGTLVDAPPSPLPGARWVLVTLLPGMVLLVREDAAAVVRRAAAEIVERFGAAGG